MCCMHGMIASKAGRICHMHGMIATKTGVIDRQHDRYLSARPDIRSRRGPSRWLFTLTTLAMSEPIAATLAARFTQRLLERDAPPPPPSQEPEAVLDRIQAWLLPPGGTRDTRTHRRLARMLVALMEHPERSTAQLTTASGTAMPASGTSRSSRSGPMNRARASMQASSGSFA